MKREYVLDVFHRQLALWPATPGDVVRFGTVGRVRSVPPLVVWVQMALHCPGSRRVVHVIGIRGATERGARVNDVIVLPVVAQGEVEVVVSHKGTQVCGAEVLTTRSFCVGKVEPVDP